jgi:hypothetical protein
MAPFVKNPVRIVIGSGAAPPPPARAGSAPRRKGRELENLEAGPYGLPPDLAAYAAAAGLIPEGELTPELRSLNTAAAREQAMRFEKMATPWYVVLVFQSREQRDTFMAKTGWEKHGSEKYVDGEVLALALGLPLPPGPFPNRLKPAIGFQQPGRVTLRGASLQPTLLAGRSKQAEAVPVEEAEQAPKLTEEQQKLKAATKREQEQRYQNTSSEFWAAISLQSVEQREAFIDEMNWRELFNEDGGWIDGEAVAQQFEVEIPKAPRLNKLRQNRVYLPFAEPLPSGHEFALDHEPDGDEGDSDDESAEE